MANIIPPVGSKGIFKLLAPFDTKLIPEVSYLCAAVRQFSDVTAMGIDPQAVYYTANGLVPDKYQTDQRSGVCIVSLQAGDGNWVYVPSSYIISYPEMGGVPYTALVLGINLGAIPDQLDLSYLKTKIRDSVRDVIGIESTVRSVSVSETELISQTSHQANEVARADRVRDTNTDYAKYLSEKARADAATQKIAELEAYIRTRP